MENKKFPIKFCFGMTFDNYWSNFFLDVNQHESQSEEDSPSSEENEVNLGTRRNPPRERIRPVRLQRSYLVEDVLMKPPKKMSKPKSKRAKPMRMSDIIKNLQPCYVNLVDIGEKSFAEKQKSDGKYMSTNNALFIKQFTVGYSKSWIAYQFLQLQFIEIV